MPTSSAECKRHGLCPCAAGAYDITCDPHPEVIERMVQWGQTRQRAFDDAIAATPSSTVRLLFYIEFNHGAKALEGKAGQLNSVVERVNPDLVSYSAYVSTNACELSTTRTSTARCTATPLGSRSLQTRTRPTSSSPTTHFAPCSNSLNRNSHQSPHLHGAASAFADGPSSARWALCRCTVRDRRVGHFSV